MRPPEIVLPTFVLALALAGCEDEAPSERGSVPAESAGDADAKRPADADEKAAQDEPAPEPPKEKAQGWGVLAAGTAIYGQPAGAEVVRLPETLTEGVTVIARGEVEGGRVRIEALLPVEPAKCVSQMSGLRDFSLRLFVDRESFVDVTSREVSHEFEDGTSVKLAPGVPTIRAPLGVGSATANGVTVRLPVEADAVGRFFEPSPPLHEGTPEGWLPAQGDPLRYGDGRTLDVAAMTDKLGVNYYADERKGLEYLVTLRTACMEAKVLSSAARIADARDRVVGTKSGLYAMKGPKDAIPEMARSFDPDMSKHAGILGTLRAEGTPHEDVWGGLTGTEIGESYGVGGLGLVGTTGERYTVSTDTKVLWADGSPAGTVRAEHRFLGKPEEEGELRCWDVSPMGDADAKLRLCFAQSDVEDDSPRTGYGISYGFGGRGKKVARVRAAKAGVKGALDKDIIRRIVRAHINEVRYCYNQGLVRDPALEGKVTIDFVIDAKGKVSSSTVASETITDSKVSKCIAKAVKRWKFPRPKGGGTVSVSYPFSLSPG